MIKSSKTAVKMYPNKPEHAALPDNYLKHAREIDTPVLFMTGRNNRVFADSNILCFNRLKELAPGNRHELLIRSEEHTSELQSLMRTSYAVSCLKKKRRTKKTRHVWQYTQQ